MEAYSTSLTGEPNLLFSQTEAAPSSKKAPINPGESLDTTSKVTLFVGLLFTMGLITTTILAKVNPSHFFGDSAHTVEVATAVTGTIFGVATIGYAYLAKRDAQATKERYKATSKQYQENSDKFKQFISKEIEANNKLEEQTQEATKAETTETAYKKRLRKENEKGEKTTVTVHNLEADTPLPTSFSGTYHKIPALGRYREKDLIANGPEMAVKFPKNQLSHLTFLESLNIPHDYQVEFFFNVFLDEEGNALPDPVRNVFAHPMYIENGGCFDERKQILMGIFEPINIEVHQNAKKDKRYTFMLPEDGLPIGHLETRAVQVHNNGRWSPNNTQVILKRSQLDESKEEDESASDTSVSSFYLVTCNSQTKKLTVCHMIIVQDDTKGDGHAIAEASEKKSAAGFLGALSGYAFKNEKLGREIETEFAFFQEELS